MSKYRIGDKIIWGNVDGVNDEVSEGTVTKTSPSGGGIVWVDGKHKPEDCIYEAFCWPAQFRAELIEIMEHRHLLKKAFDDSMTLVYQLRNKVSRWMTENMADTRRTSSCDG